MPKRLSARERLAQHMDDRRLALDLRWADVAEMAGVSTETLRQVRFNESQIRPLTKRGIERALAWRQGSVNAILIGGDPTPDEEALGVRVRRSLAEVGDPRVELHTIIDGLDTETASRVLHVLRRDFVDT